VVAWQPYVEEYFKPEDRVQALRIIFCESSGRPNVIGNNTNGTQDVGGWQFNDKTWAWLKGKLKFTGDRTGTQADIVGRQMIDFLDGLNKFWEAFYICTVTVLLYWGAMEFRK